MSRPKAYEPEHGYMYQILTKGPAEREWEHIDYAKDREEKQHLLSEYALAYRGNGYAFKTIQLPKKYWE